MKFSDLMEYQTAFYRVLERAKRDQTLSNRIWNDPLRVLATEGINELDVVDFLRQLQSGTLATDAGWGNICYPIQTQDLMDSPIRESLSKRAR